METIFIILIISVLGPVIGSLIGVIRKPSEKFVFNMLSFAGGVMLAISFLHLIPESIALSSVPLAVFGIIIGAVFMYGVDKMIPHIHPNLSQEQGCNLKRTSFYLIMGIFLHNFPEGMAMALGTVSGEKVSLLIALAIAIHNIPEGICTSAPYYACTKKRLRSFLVSSATAIPILVGFFLASILYSIIPVSLVGFIVGATAGLMIYIVSDEIIPASCCKLSNHTTIFSLIIGVLLVMLLDLL